VKREIKVPRAPFNVLIYPYRQAGDGEYEYALLRRADAGFWQGVTGGGEDDEAPLQAARRETNEETGLPPDSAFLQLDTVEPVPVTEFNVGDLWGEDVYVIPQYCFGVLAEERELVLSREHTEYRWLTYEQAHSLLKWDGNRTALWELNRKVRGLGPRD
jgi:dATP pyrophosphohydrolase